MMATLVATCEAEESITCVRIPVPAWLGHAAVHTPADTIAAPTNCNNTTSDVSCCLQNSHAAAKAVYHALQDKPSQRQVIVMSIEL